MSRAATTHIAGWKTADDWRELRAVLVAGASGVDWHRAFEEFFYERISSRYLEPIKVLQENGTFQGEGFSIMAVQCSLIEFLESTVQGLNYRHLKPGEKLGPFEYSKSSDLFVHFLSKRQPFATQFDEALARDFYSGVRCALLHEARTKGGWKIWAKGPTGTVIDRTGPVVYRDNFQAALLQFISAYQTALPARRPLQEAFVRKFDSLCE